jgi:hypothetical protein
MATLVIPGKSTRVKLGTHELYTVRMIGSLTIFFELPHTFSVSFSILRLTSSSSRILIIDYLSLGKSLSKIK